MIWQKQKQIYISMTKFQFRISVFCTFVESEVWLFHFFETILVREKSPLAKVKVEKGEHDQTKPDKQNDSQFAVRSHLGSEKNKMSVIERRWIKSSLYVLKSKYL